MTEPWEQHRAERRAVFETDAAAYDAARPGYPTELFDDLVSITGLGPDARVLEVGCGTGQATRPLAERGWRVTAVELGATLAAIARRNLADLDRVEVLHSAFEDWAGPRDAFDLVASATAFHWIEPSVAVPLAADALRAGGWLAVWWHVYGDPDRPDPFHDRARPLLERWFPTYRMEGDLPYALDTTGRVADLGAGGLFGEIEVRRYPWTGTHTSAELRALFSTFSPARALEPTDQERNLDQLERLVDDEFGGSVTRPYITILYAAQRQ